MTAFPPKVTPDEAAHATAGYMLGFSSTLFQMWLNPDAAAVTTRQLIAIALRVQSSAMAGAKCDFYMAKQSTAALLYEGKKHLLRLLQEIALGEAEHSAVQDGVTAYENLRSKLVDIPTPAGPRDVRSAPRSYRSHRRGR